MANRIRDKLYVDLVRQLPCSVRDEDCDDRWIELHHRTDLQRGKGQKAGDGEVFPLCVVHHGSQCGLGVHGGRKTWEAKYGSQEDHVTRTRALIRARGYDPPPRDPPAEVIPVPTF